MKAEEERIKEIAQFLATAESDTDEAFFTDIARMIVRFEKYANGKAFQMKDGEIVLNEYAASRVSVEFGYSGAYLRQYIKLCIEKGILN